MGQYNFPPALKKSFLATARKAIQIQIRILITNVLFVRDTANRLQPFPSPIRLSLRTSAYFIANKIVLNQQVESTSFLLYENCLNSWRRVYNIYFFNFPLLMI